MVFDFDKVNSDEELRANIDSRLNDLYSNAPKRTVVGFESMSPLKNIIPRDTLIDNGGSYYNIKNNEYIYEFISILKRNNINNIDQALNNIYNFISYYFGKDGDDEKRQNIFNQHTFNDSYPDISVLRNQNAAMCSERAAMAQNLFSFFGIESYYLTGYLKVNEQQEPHAFNLIKYKGKFMIYDSSKDVPIYEKNKIVGYRHYLQEVNDDFVNCALKSEKTIILNDYYLTVQDKSLVKIPSSQRIYSSMSYGTKIL